MKQVDKYFKNKIQHHESPVPQDMWDRIAPALEEESKRTRPFLWFMFSLGLLVFAGGLWMLNSSSTESGTLVSKQKDVISLGEDTKSIKERYDIATNTSVSEISLSDKKAEVTLLQTKRKDSAIAGSEQKIIENIAPSELDDYLENSEQKYKSSDQTPINQLRQVEKNKGTFDIPGQLSSMESDGKDIKLIVTKSYFDRNNNTANENATTTTLVHESRGLTEKIEEITLPINQVEFLKTDNNDLGIKLFSANAPKCPSFVNKRIGLFVDGYISHDITHHQYSGNTEYSMLRDMSETSIYGYGAGIRFSFFLSDGFGIRSGINYSQVNQKFEVDDPNATDTKIQIVQEIVVDANGDSTVISREEIIEVGGRRQITNYNKYQFLDIPVLLFYEFGGANSRFYYSVNAGAYINLLFNQSGKYLSESNDIIDFSGDDENPNPYNSNAGASLYASFGIHYILNDNVDIVLEPHFLRQVGSLTRNRYPLRQRLTTFGLNTGLRYKF